MAIISWNDLFDLEDDQQLRQAIKVIESFEKAYQDFGKSVQTSADNVKKEQEELVKSIKELDKSIDKLSPTTEENRKELDKLAKQAEVASGQYDQMKKQIVTLKGSYMDLTKEQKEYQKAAEATINADKEREKLLKRLAKLNTKEAKDIEELKVKIQQKTKELRENAKATLGVVKEQSQFSKNQSKLTSLLEQNTGALGTATNAAKGFGVQLKALAANPIILVLTAIVGIITTLVSAWKATTAGAVQFEKITAILSNSLGVLLGRIGDLINGTISFKEFLFETDDALIANAKAVSNLIDNQRKLELQLASSESAQAGLTKALVESKQARDDDNVSLNIRLKSGQLALKQETRLQSLRVSAARSIEEQARLELEAATNEEERRKAGIALIQAQTAVLLAQAEEIDAVREAEIQLGLVELDIFEQRLDLLLDITDRQKTLNEQRAVQAKDLQKQKALFQENDRIIEDSFQKQIDLFEELGSVTIDQNRLLRSTSTELIIYAEELGFAERAVNRLREVVIEKTQADQDNSSALNEVNKKLESQRRIQQALQATQQDLSETPIIPEERLQPIETAQKELTKLQQIGLKVKTFFQQAFGTDLEQVFTNIGNTILDVFSTVDQALSIGEERRIQRSEREIERLEEQKEQEIAIAGENVEAQIAIEQRFNDQIRQQEEQIARERRRQAQREKAAAVISSIIDTALAVTKTIGQTGFFGIPLAAIVGAFGAAQTAIIAAQPIPQFFKGTKNSPEGLAWVGERGRELIKTPDGKTFLSDNKPQLVDLPQGSQVLTNSITERMLRDSSIGHKESAAKIRENKQMALNEAFVHGVKEMVANQPDSEEIVKSVLSNIPLQIFDFHKGDFRKHIRKGTSTRNEVMSENRYGR